MSDILPREKSWKGDRGGDEAVMGGREKGVHVKKV